MFDEAKVRKDIQRMREAYEKAQKSLAAVRKRQAEIAEEISKYKARNKYHNKPTWEI
jgi:hypothetical protein